MLIRTSFPCVSRVDCLLTAQSSAAPSDAPYPEDSLGFTHDLENIFRGEPVIELLGSRTLGLEHVVQDVPVDLQTR